MPANPARVALHCCSPSTRDTSRQRRTASVTHTHAQRCLTDCCCGVARQIGSLERCSRPCLAATSAAGADTTRVPVKHPPRPCLLNTLPGAAHPAVQHRGALHAANGTDPHLSSIPGACTQVGRYVPCCQLAAGYAWGGGCLPSLRMHTHRRHCRIHTQGTAAILLHMPVQTKSRRARLCATGHLCEVGITGAVSQGGCVRMQLDTP